jgi:hypothetical protein
VLLVLIGLVFFVIPLPIPFSGSFQTASLGGGGGMYSSSFTNGSSVSGSWSASSTQPVALVIVSASGAHVFAGDGASGSFQFTSNGGSYEFAGTSLVPETVSVSGSVSETLFSDLAGS